MKKKLSLVSVLLFVLILAVVAIGCSNVLLKPHQSNPSIRVQLEKSSGARNATTGDYQITAWIENQDGTESHHQEINSTAGEAASIIFEKLVIGSEIKIHLELMENNDTQKKFTGTSSWTTVNEGTNVIVIVLKEASDTGEMDGPVSGDDPEDEGDPVLTWIEAQYTGTYQLVGNAISLNNISITQHFDNGSSLSVNGNDSNYTVVFDSGVNSNTAIGKVPATVTHKTNPQITADFTIPVKYQLDASKLTISGDTSVEQNGTLELTANYPDTIIYQIHDADGSSTSYNVKNNLSISWTGGATGNSWTATADTTTTEQKTATVTLSPNDEWCVTTAGITAKHEYTVTAVTQTYNIGDEYRDASGTLKGYVFEVNATHIKIVETSESLDFYWCGASTNINNWSDLINISDGEEMYNAVKNQPTGDNSIFTYANNKNTSGASGWYIPTKDELIAIYNMNNQYSKLSNLSGAYWSSSISSTTNYKAFYVIMDDGTFADEFVYTQGNSVVAVKKIEL